MWLWLLACGGSSLPPSFLPYDRDADGVLSVVDCDDLNAGIYPGANDPPYDGVDGNCDGSDDYDVDGDGERWVAHGGTDCNDTNADVNSQGVEVPYDGFDNDCDPATTDNDLDADGSPWPSDCDDNDPLIFPGAKEAIGDFIDQDCGGDGDSTSMAPWPGRFSHPRSLRLSTFEEAPVLAAIADTYLPEATATLDPAPLYGAGFAWLAADLPEPEVLQWHGLDQTDPDRFDAVDAIDIQGTPEALWIAASTRSWVNDDPLLTLRPYIRFGGAITRQNGPGRIVTDRLPAQLVDVVVGPDGLAYATAAFPTAVTWLHGGLNETGPGLGGTADVDASAGAAILGDELLSCGASGCDQYLLPSDGAVANPVPFDGSVRVFREHDGYWIVGTNNGAQILGDISVDLFPGEEIVDLDAVMHPTRPLVVAVGAVARGGVHELQLAYGEVDQGSLSVARLTLESGLRPQSVAIWADEERIFVAAGVWDPIGLDHGGRIVVAQLLWAD